MCNVLCIVHAGLYLATAKCCNVSWALAANLTVFNIIVKDKNLILNVCIIIKNLWHDYIIKHQLLSDICIVKSKQGCFQLECWYPHLRIWGWGTKVFQSASSVELETACSSGGGNTSLAVLCSFPNFFCLSSKLFLNSQKVK